jgi:hypothetical protein
MHEPVWLPAPRGPTQPSQDVELVFSHDALKLCQQMPISISVPDQVQSPAHVLNNQSRCHPDTNLPMLQSASRLTRTLCKTSSANRDMEAPEQRMSSICKSARSAVRVRSTVSVPATIRNEHETPEHTGFTVGNRNNCIMQRPAQSAQCRDPQAAHVYEVVTTATHL